MKNEKGNEKKELSLEFKAYLKCVAQGMASVNGSRAEDEFKQITEDPSRAWVIQFCRSSCEEIKTKKVLCKNIVHLFSLYCDPRFVGLVTKWVSANAFDVTVDQLRAIEEGLRSYSNQLGGGAPVKKRRAAKMNMQQLLRKKLNALVLEHCNEKVGEVFQQPYTLPKAKRRVSVFDSKNGGDRKQPRLERKLDPLP